MSNLEQIIRERAHQLWVESGSEHGRAQPKKRTTPIPQ
ncbi:DUF2934 domain-containing protein [Bradyrhizobium sp. 197]|nr:DUF2934 domain-containing protein [Bradyrhizobium sp. 197]